ncbi:MAG: haloacid dehalogenase type II [Hyphomonadaceae bacterium]|jgi:2-haloacid dehalogenase|nr:haloacid dehalogenase type II [Hyphomonadaceae bacterium]
MRLYVFDAYGTLFDVHAAAERHKDAIGPKWQQLSQTWRTKHIEYSWHASLIGRPAMFWSLTERSLDHAIAAVGGGVSSDVRAKLLAAYRAMDAYPEVREVLSALKARGDKLAILSNGDPDMLADAVRAAGLDGLFDAVLSVWSAGSFKPSMKVYQLVIDRFGGGPADVSFQSSNRWDIAGAKAFGFTCVWINRTGALDEYADLAPDRAVRDLRALLDAV